MSMIISHQWMIRYDYQREATLFRSYESLKHTDDMEGSYVLSKL